MPLLFRKSIAAGVGRPFFLPDRPHPPAALISVLPVLRKVFRHRHVRTVVTVRRFQTADAGRRCHAEDGVGRAERDVLRGADHSRQDTEQLPGAATGEVHFALDYR